MANPSDISSMGISENKQYIPSAGNVSIMDVNAPWLRALLHFISIIITLTAAFYSANWLIWLPGKFIDIPLVIYSTWWVPVAGFIMAAWRSIAFWNITLYNYHGYWIKELPTLGEKSSRNSKWCVYHVNDIQCISRWSFVNLLGSMATEYTLIFDDRKDTFAINLVIKITNIKRNIQTNMTIYIITYF